LGIPIAVGHDPSHLGDANTVVYSSAISKDNVEMQAASRRGLRILHRQQVLAELVDAHRTIGVAGTHGKTTTAVMAATLLKQTGVDPSYLLGAGCAGLCGHAHWGNGEALVLEVDESDGRFLQFQPALAVITSVGLDHLNHYENQRAIDEGFRQFVDQSKEAILCADDAGCQRLLERFSDALSYGLNPAADLVAEGVVQERFQTFFSLRFRGKQLGRAKLPFPGLHNVYNAQAALLARWRFGVPFERMLPLLSSFQLPKRRFEVLADDGVVVVDDYAHLPEQVLVNLKAIRSGWRRGRVVALFQPHRFSRMLHLAEAFGPVFEDADVVGVTDIYPAFEAPIPGVTGQSVFDEVTKHHPQACFLPRPKSVTDFLKQTIRSGDFVIGFGAGDLSRLLRRFAAPPNRGATRESHVAVCA